MMIMHDSILMCLCDLKMQFEMLTAGCETTLGWPGSVHGVSSLHDSFRASR